jgi:hypothetical protein
LWYTLFMDTTRPGSRIGSLRADGSDGEQPLEAFLDLATIGDDPYESLYLGQDIVTGEHLFLDPVSGEQWVWGQS